MSIYISVSEICALYEILLCDLQVNTFRSMMHDDMMVGAFSHSTAIGKLRKDLPDVPEDARVNCPRYTLDEAASVCHYYLRYANEIYLLASICNVEQC